MLQLLYVGIGGFIGASLRYLTTITFTSQTDLPIVTLIINFLGAFFIGFMSALAGDNEFISKEFQTFFQAGICGGFSTFAAFSLETVSLIEVGKIFIAGVYIILSVVFCLLGIVLGRSFAGVFIN